MKLVTIADLQRPESETSPLILQAQSLGGLWMEFLKQDQEKHSYTVTDYGEKERSPGIHSSEMSKCMRKMVYSITATERSVAAATSDAQMKLRFRTGTALHGMIQSDFERMGRWYTAQHINNGYALIFESELKIKADIQAKAKDWDLSSSCDGAFTFLRLEPEGWEPYLRVGLEIKTSSDGEFIKRKKPEEAHLEQTCLYQAVLDLPIMWLLYYNKSNSNFTTPYSPWLFKFDKNLWERDLEIRFAKGHHYAETKTLPPKVEGSHCAWCPFGHTCQPDVLKRGKSNFYYQPPAVSTGGMRARGR